jgi:hypothetical protein
MQCVKQCCLPEDHYRRRQCPQYLVAGYLPDNFDPSQADEALGRDIHALNKEMIAAGGRKFACGHGGEVRPFFRSNTPSE